MWQLSICSAQGRAENAPLVAQRLHQRGDVVSHVVDEVVLAAPGLVAQVVPAHVDGHTLLDPSFGFVTATRVLAAGKSGASK